VPVAPRPPDARRTDAAPGAGQPDDDPRTLVDLLSPEGALATALPDYEHREAQLQMLLAVAQIMRRGGRLVVEAGTGTGKSLAYLVPALARAVRRGERVVVSTHTHTLQEQLMAKDIPALREWLPWEFEACLLKGRPNYVSLRRWRRYLLEPCRDADELKFKLKVLVWLHKTETGDRSELRLQGAEEVFWARIASDPLDCVGLRCTEEDCFVHRARAEAERADLVVVNHALLLADASTGGSLIPAHDHLVVDEAHHLEDSATQSLRCDLDGQGLDALLRRLVVDDEGRRTGLIPDMRGQPHLGSSGDSLAAAEESALAAALRCAELFRAAADWARRQLPDDLLRRDEAVRLVPELREQPEWAPLAGQAGDAATALPEVESRLPVGSSARTITGRLAIARAIATRWRSPPDSCGGRWVSAATGWEAGSRTRTCASWRSSAAGWRRRRTWWTRRSGVRTRTASTG